MIDSTPDLSQPASMRIHPESDVHSALTWPTVLDALKSTFGGQFTMPQRQVMPLNPHGPGHDAFALLPAWNDQYIAVKAFTYFPENPAPHPSLHSLILVFDRHHGTPIALVHGTSVTYWRTAGVSALAATYLAREDSKTLFLLGTGNLAPYLIAAHAHVRPLKRVLLWGRNPEKVRSAAQLASQAHPHLEIHSVDSIEAACHQADIVVCATGSPEILVRSTWIRPGTHTDFLGNHHADKRECDTPLVTRSRVFVDTRVNCFKEAGELLVPVQEGQFSLDQVVAELSELCHGSIPGRTSESEITLFKSVGAALGDLATAAQVIRTLA